tara:strand:+ start:453 stop:764 length:312 start_codon:yes stop_codon:yes gene_type:complete
LDSSQEMHSHGEHTNGGGRENGGAHSHGKVLVVLVLVFLLILSPFGDNEVFKLNTGLPGPGIIGFAFHLCFRCDFSDVSFGGVFGVEIAQDHISKAASSTAVV